MKTLINIATAILLTVLSVTAMAQMVDEAEVKEITAKYDLGLTKRPSTSFLDLSRLNLSHSYTIGYFSGNGFSGSRAMYNGTIQYQIANPLTLTLNMGVLHDPGAIFGDRKLSENSKFLPSGWLDWRPSRNFQMSIGFETVPAYNYGGYYLYPGRSLSRPFR